MHKILALLFALALLVGTLALTVTVAGANDSSTCKFGQRNRPGCTWPTTTTTGGIVCRDRGCGGFPR